MINKHPLFKGLHIRIPIMIPIKGRGFINQGSTLSFRKGYQSVRGCCICSGFDSSPEGSTGLLAVHHAAASFQPQSSVVPAAKKSLAEASETIRSFHTSSPLDAENVSNPHPERRASGVPYTADKFEETQPL